MSKIKNKNGMIKFLALFISILLWSYVRGEVNPKSVKEFKGVNVEFTNERILNDAGLIVLDPKEMKISVKVSGRRSDVNSINPEDITAQVNLSGVSKGSQRILIDILVPFKVDLEDVSERYVVVEIDKLETIQRPVEINTNGEEYIISESTISPQVINISGPSTLINRVSKVIVDIDMKNMKENSVLKLPVKVIDKKGEKISGLQTNPDMVEVSLPLSDSKQVSVKPNWIGELEGINLDDITINPATVLIRGLAKNIKDINEIETEAIDISDIKETEVIETVLVLPKGITTESGETKITLKVDINKDNTKILTVPITQIDFKNLNDEMNASFYEISNIQEISLKLKGDSDRINEVNFKDIRLELDLKNLEEGIYEIELKVIPIKDVMIKSINSETVKVKIQKN